MSTQAAVSRANGAQSIGPITREGKARSAMNALRHGMNSDLIVLPHESREAFDRLVSSYVRDFKPSNLSQRDLVETMAAARWRLNRLIAMETQHLANQLEKSPDCNLAEAFSRSANEDRTLALLIRYEGQVNRTYERAFKQLIALQNQPTPAASPNISGHLHKIRNEPRDPAALAHATPNDDALTKEFGEALAKYLELPAPRSSTAV